MPNNEHPYNLRHLRQFKNPPLNTVHHGAKSVYFLGPKIWEILPDSFKNMERLEAFKREIKTWKPENCPCRPCRVYVQNIGFL